MTCHWQKSIYYRTQPIFFSHSLGLLFWALLSKIKWKTLQNVRFQNHENRVNLKTTGAKTSTTFTPLLPHSLPPSLPPSTSFYSLFSTLCIRINFFVVFIIEIGEDEGQDHKPDARAVHTESTDTRKSIGMCRKEAKPLLPYLKWGSSSWAAFTPIKILQKPF